MRGGKVGALQRRDKDTRRARVVCIQVATEMGSLGVAQVGEDGIGASSPGRGGIYRREAEVVRVAPRERRREEAGDTDCEGSERVGRGLSGLA